MSLVRHLLPLRLSTIDIDRGDFPVHPKVAGINHACAIRWKAGVNGPDEELH